MRTLAETGGLLIGKGILLVKFGAAADGFKMEIVSMIVETILWAAAAI